MVLHMWYYSVVVIEIVWFKYANWNISRTYQCMYYVLCAIVLFWQIILSYFYGTLYEPIFYILYFYADMVAYRRMGWIGTILAFECVCSGAYYFLPFFFRGIYVHTHEVLYGGIFEKKTITVFRFLLKLRVPIHPRDGVNRNINQMATTGPCGPNRGWIGTTSELKINIQIISHQNIYLKKYHFQ